MAKFSYGFFLLVTGLLFYNALCVLFNLLLSYPTFTTVHQADLISVRNKTYLRGVCHCPKCPGTSDGPPNPSFSTVEYFLPPGPSKLSPLASRKSLTRVGNELSFDYSSCPADSIAKSSDQWRTEPIHSSCPAVFVIGARKAGTTSLFYYLSGHPEFEGIRLDKGPRSGETFHFSSRYITEDWATYMRSFPKQYIMTGEASVGNFVNCEVPKRIFDSCGNFSKIIIMLRNPIDRYISNFMMRVNLGTREFSNESAISRSIQLDIQHYINALLSNRLDITTAFGNGGLKSWSKFRCLFNPSINMVYEGLYYIHVLNWLCNYPSEHILFLNSEEFYDKPVEILKEVYQFLGLDPLSDSQREAITSFIYNKGTKSTLHQHILQDADRKKLKKVYNFFNDGILEQLNWSRFVNWN